MFGEEFADHVVVGFPAGGEPAQGLLGFGPDPDRGGHCGSLLYTIYRMYKSLAGSGDLEEHDVLDPPNVSQMTEIGKIVRVTLGLGEAI